jgi:two-component system cell cycle response regulator PopA
MAKPLVLVLADAAAEAVVAAAGFAVAGGGEPLGGPSAGVLIDVRGAAGLVAGQRARALKAALGPRAGVFFAWADDDSDYDADAFDGALPSDATPALVQARLGFALRVAVMAEEAEARFASLAKFGGAASPPSLQREQTPRVLLYGDPGPAAIAFTAALETLGARVVGCFSSFTAFDYLHAGGFDAVAVLAGWDRGAALSFCAALRRNARLFHLPCLILADAAFPSPEDVLRRGASDLAVTGVDDAAAALRLLGRVDEARRREALALAFAAARAPAAMDVATGLYGEAFFVAHLDALILRAAATERPLSICVARIAPSAHLEHVRAGQGLERVVGQVGAMLGRLVRTEDVAACVGPTTFAVAFPASDLEAATIAAERIVAVLECGAFDAGETQQAVSFKMDAVGRRHAPGDTARGLLDAALAALPNPWT